MITAFDLVCRMVQSKADLLKVEVVGLEDLEHDRMV